MLFEKDKECNGKKMPESDHILAGRKRWLGKYKVLSSKVFFFSNAHKRANNARTKRCPRVAAYWLGPREKGGFACDTEQSPPCHKCTKALLLFGQILRDCLHKLPILIDIGHPGGQEKNVKSFDRSLERF